MRPRLLFIYLDPASFVREDMRILGEHFEIVPFRFGGDGPRGAWTVIRFGVKQLFFLLRELPRSRAVFGWFVDYHMVLPVILARPFGKPVLVSVGGYDARRLPSLGSGVVVSRWRWPLARMVMKRADVLLPVSPSLVLSTNRFSEWPRETRQGIRAFLERTTARIEVVPTGYDPDAWPMGPTHRERIVSTVGFIDSDRTLRVKGVDLVMDVARMMPDVQFRVIGVMDPAGVRARYRVPDNVELLEPVAREALVDHYQASSVYLQLSRAEGLPNVLCEAMLCGCMPVGSRVFGIPDAVGDVGLLVDSPDPGGIRDAVARALETAAAHREAARSHIVSAFHVDRRRAILLSVLNELTDANASDA